MSSPTPTLASQGASSSHHVAALDGIRGAAILIVLVHNCFWIMDSGTHLLPKIVGSVAATGWVGVQLFFVLSGFLITGILVEAKGTEAFFRTFYIRRTLRIFPLYYMFLVGALLVAPLFASPSWASSARQNQWWYWTYTLNWGAPFGHDVVGLAHFWSLAVEEQFYLLWPLVVFALSPRKLLLLCGAIILATPIVRLLLLDAGLPPLTTYEFTIARWDALALGASLTLLLRESVGRHWLARRRLPIVIAALLVLVTIGLLDRGFRENSSDVEIIGQTAIAILFGWLLYACAAPTSNLERGIQQAASARWLQFLGKYSYAIYVFHFPIHTIASRSLANVVNGADTHWRLVRAVAYVSAVGLASIAVAMISWVLLEKPFLDLKNRLAPRKEAGSV